MDTPKADEIASKKVDIETIAVKEDVVEQTGVVTRKPKTNIKPTLIIIAAAILGLALGIGLSDGRGSEVAISWVKLPGDLFIRALKCIVLPLVFVNIILAMVDMISAGKASSIGGITIGLYTLTTVLASIEGLIFILMFKSSFKVNTDDETPLNGLSKIQCPSSGYLASDENSTLFCLDVNSTIAEFFEVLNPNKFLQTAATSQVDDDISFSTTLQDGIFRKLVSDNIFNEFIKANFVGVIIFAIVFGAASQSIPRVPKVALLLIGEINRILLLIVDWIIFLTPIAVLSLIAGNIGGQTKLAESFSNIGLLMAATFLAMIFHYFVIYVGMFYLLVRKNPFPYMRFLIPAQTFAFASASSAATLPLSLECVASSGAVPASVNNFVLSMGATLNMDGGAIYFPTAIVFLAVSSGLGDKLDAAAYFLIVLLSTLGSAGTAPVPSASLVLIITAYNTVFDTTGTPEAFGLIFTVDWLMDRFRTTLNVTGDMVMARIITAVSKIPMDAA